MRQAGSRKATPEIPVPGDARGSPPSLQRAVPGGHVARRMGGGGRIRRAGTQGMEQTGTGLNSAPPPQPPHSALVPLLPPELGSRVGAVVGGSSPPGLP